MNREWTQIDANKGGLIRIDLRAFAVRFIHVSATLPGGNAFF
jgi:hypothetical protein